MSELVSESMSELEEQRWKIVAAYLAEHETVNSAVAAELLGVHTKTAARLLLKAENIGLLLSYGKTRNKIYKITKKSPRSVESGGSLYSAKLF